MTDETAATAADGAPTAGSVRRAAQIVLAVGVLFSVLFIVSIVALTRIPPATASDAEILAFYGGSGASLPLLVGLYLIPFAGIAFIYFIVALRIWEAVIGERPAVLLSSLQLVSGILFVVLVFVAAAAITVVAATAEVEGGTVNLEAARQFPIFGRAILLFFALRMAAMFIFSTSMLERRRTAFPRWFVGVGFVTGALLIATPIFSPFLMLAIPVWVLVLCSLAWRAVRRIPPDLRVDDLRRGLDPVTGLPRDQAPDA